MLNDENEPVTPSVVAVRPDGVAVDRAARKFLLTDPAATFSFIKRKMGENVIAAAKSAPACKKSGTSPGLKELYAYRTACGRREPHDGQNSCHPNRAVHRPGN